MGDGDWIVIVFEGAFLLVCAAVIVLIMLALRDPRPAAERRATRDYEEESRRAVARLRRRHAREHARKGV